MFRTRQAPSPTGYLHFGTARTLLFTHYISRINNGMWYLRLDDTDRNRLQPDAVGSLLESMRVLGLIPDEGLSPDKKGIKDDFYNVYSEGEYGPYIQSQRLEIYHKYAQQLIDQKLCYWSYVTPEIKEELSTFKQITKKPIDYFQANLQILSNAPVTEKTKLTNIESELELFQSVSKGLNDNRKPDLKFRINQDRIVENDDMLLGKSKFDLNLEEDFTVLKSDGFPTYHLAHAVDDQLMNTSVNIRSQEWISSLPKHIKLFEALGFDKPVYMHVPPILGETGNKKMSKRDGNVNMEDWLKKGYLPEAIVNYLSFLGWNPGTDKEIYLDIDDFVLDTTKTIEENKSIRLRKLLDNISQDFSIDKMQKSPARFSTDKLNWFNKEYLKMLSPYEFAYLSQKNKNIQQLPAPTRIGDYVYMVDVDNSRILGGYDNSTTVMSGVDGIFYPIGGGRGENQDSIESLLREISEETQDTIQVDAKELLFIEQLNIPWETSKEFNSKQMNIYHLIRSESNTKPFINIEDYNKYSNTWASLNSVLGNNSYLTFPIYNEFCKKNNIKAPKLDSLSESKIISSILDIPRRVTLIDDTSESSIIHNYNVPTQDIVKWKKSTIEETLENLKVLKPTIKTILDSVKNQKINLSKSVFSPHTLTEFTKLSAEIENKLKTNLKENDMDFGAHLGPLRIALSGLERSPSPFELLSILDDTEIFNRIDNVIYPK